MSTAVSAIKLIVSEPKWHWGIGPIKPPATEIDVNENLPLDVSHGLQTCRPGSIKGDNAEPFTDLVLGKYGEKREEKYLFTIDERGLNIICEHTKFPTPRGIVVHTNISPNGAVVAGEVWFRRDQNGELIATINSGSKRYPLQAATNWHPSTLLWELPNEKSPEHAQVQAQWEATAQYWLEVGIKTVELVPLGQRFGSHIEPKRYTKAEPISIEISRHHYHLAYQL